MANLTPPAPRCGVARSLRRAAALALLCLAPLPAAVAQQARENGPRTIDPAWHALTGAAVVVEPGVRLENATVVLRDGVIVSVVENADAPAGARVWDYSGLTIYPGLIDAHLPVDAPAPDSGAPGSHWSKKITPQRRALDGSGPDKPTREALRKMGFTAAAIAPNDGILRGFGAIVALSEPPEPGQPAREPYRSDAFHAAALDHGSWGSREYPGSQMGAIALLRQTLLDAQWHADQRNRASESTPRTIPADALDALNNADADTPLLFVADDEKQALRVAKIAREFDRPFIVRGSGEEYQRLGAIASLKAPIIVPLNFPEKPKLNTYADQEAVDLATLMAWEQAPTNARRLHDAGVPFALTTDRLKNRGDFTKNLRSAIKHGLSEDAALAALTTAPAEILGVQDSLGAIREGFAANLVVIDGDSLFDESATIRDVWIDGARYEINAASPSSIDGEWTADDSAVLQKIEIANKGKKVTAHLAQGEEGDDATTVEARSVTRTDDRLSFLVDLPAQDDRPAVWTVDLVLAHEGDTMTGVAVSPRGASSRLALTRAPDDNDAQDDNGSDENNEKETDEDALADIPETLGLPFGPYALETPPEQRDILITGATIWTSGPQGIIENGSLLVRDGKVAAVGRANDRAFHNLNDIHTIDARGKHITPGLIDAHSHTGIDGGVNEGTLSSTAQVRIADVINPDAINFYRQLAGGLTMANQLHGSANAIGGQNSVIKLRWGAAHPDDMRMQGAPSGIKFALGENVKQANWGAEHNTRYPQTRMGVETFIRDRFLAARDYAAKRERGQPVRQDLELDALAEILAGERLVHCHSYRQDEILMLCRVADELGFKIGTFQHVLEGYKVADAIRDHAIGASAFSDWWAYKVEVIDAIPENGAIMHDVGVNVSFNSDSDELARRMNLEAAKAVKYGGVEPAEALKFVTINPAKQLGIEDRVGSLEPGKDADLVIWSGDPLSAFSRCEATYIDGREYFSLERDREHRENIAKERERIIQKILAEGAKTGKKPRGEGEDKSGDPQPEGEPREAQDEPEADPARDAIREFYLDLLRAGGDPTAHRCGECGSFDLHALHTH